MSTNRKCIYPHLRHSTEYKICVENIFNINFVRLIHKACRILPAVTISVIVSIFMVNAFVFVALTPNIPILFAAIGNIFSTGSSVHSYQTT